MSLKWNGAKVLAKAEAAAVRGVNQTMSLAAVHAKNNHTWINDTTELETSIRPVVAARKRGNEIVGVWGSASVLYAAFQELGTKNIPARPFLRPAGDAVYPRLAGLIRKFMR